MPSIRVAVEAPDGITRAGLTSYFRSRGEPVVADDQRATADVVVMATTRLDLPTMRALRQVASTSGAPVVLLINEVEESHLQAMVAGNVATVLPRSAVTDDRIMRHVRSIVNDAGARQPVVLSHLVKQVQRLRREATATGNVSASTLTRREADVLRLLADGLRTDEIAHELCYSERTVKHVISAITTRLQLRNRPHLVAYALRTGMLDPSPPAVDQCA